MKKDIFVDYATLDAEIRALELKKAEMKAVIFVELNELDAKTIENPYGKFTIKKNPKVWTYPKKIVGMAEELKLAQVDAQESGEATFTQGESMAFTPSKI